MGSLSPSDSIDERRIRGTRLQPRLVERIQAEFSQRDWQLFWFVVVDGQTAKEAGARFDMTSNAVRLVKMRVLRRFRQVAKELESKGSVEPSADS